MTNKILKDIFIKCSKASIQRRIQQYTPTERLNQLTEKNKLTPIEERIYLEEIRNLENEIDNVYDDFEEKYYTDYYDEDYDTFEEFLENLPKHYKNLLNNQIKEITDKYNETLYNYDKRLYLPYEISKGNQPIPKFNWDDYQHDKNGIEKFDEELAGDDYYFKRSASRQSIGEIEETQINLQEQNTKFTKKEEYWLRRYFEDGKLPTFLTYKIHQREPKNYPAIDTIFHENEEGDIYEEIIETNLTQEWQKNYKNIKNHLDKVINKTEGLTKPTILYHAGRPDPTLLPGDKGKWKGYKSMSFQEQVMDKHASINKGYWNIITLAPTGTKGICANDHRFTGISYLDEHEYLLGRNTEYTVVDIDYGTETEIVILNK